jgi:hypothetical protein
VALNQPDSLEGFQGFGDRHRPAEPLHDLPTSQGSVRGSSSRSRMSPSVQMSGVR